MFFCLRLYDIVMFIVLDIVDFVLFLVDIGLSFYLLFRFLFPTTFILIWFFVVLI